MKTNTEVIMNALGWQGGTIHQVARELGVTTDRILYASHDEMQALIGLAKEVRSKQAPPR